MTEDEYKERITQLEQALRGAQARTEEIEVLLATEPSDSMCVDHAWWYRRVQEWMKKALTPAQNVSDAIKAESDKLNAPKQWHGTPPAQREGGV